MCKELILNEDLNIIKILKGLTVKHKRYTTT